jgi:7,8-dihydroneopterin aldolase/epimerase/oxygenase
MGVTIELAGLELFGRHGALPEERRFGQRFVFDVRLETLDETAAASDRLDDVVDYRDVVNAVREVSDGHDFQVLEALAAAVADELLRRFPVESAEVRVRKPDVVLSAPLAHAAVTVRRSR